MNLTDFNRSSLIGAAVAYAARGWPVIPLKPREKTPLTKHGLLDASDNATIVSAWWHQWPEANIGLRTGVTFDVLDVDGAPGRKSLAEVAPGYFHTGPVASTGKGWHALFKPTGARNAANKQPGLDFRGERGYIVAAPSRHPNGHLYQWVRDGQLPEPPEWLFDLLTPPRSENPTGYDPASMPEILQVWQAYYSKEYPLEATGILFKTNCPWHDDSTPSFYLFPKNNSFYCFGCEEWGDSIDLTSTALYHDYEAPSTIRAT